MAVGLINMYCFKIHKAIHVAIFPSLQWIWFESSIHFWVSVVRPCFLYRLTLHSTVVTLYTTHFNSSWLWILSTQCFDFPIFLNNFKLFVFQAGSQLLTVWLELNMTSQPEGRGWDLRRKMWPWGRLYSQYICFPLLESCHQWLILTLIFIRTKLESVKQKLCSSGNREAAKEKHLQFLLWSVWEHARAVGGLL